NYWNNRAGGRVNLATDEGGTGRQSGSSFKPYALVAALEDGISPSTVFPSPTSIDIPMGNGKVWSVTNAEPSNSASMTLEDPRIASVVDRILQNVVLYGTGTAANIGRPQIGKTGTAMDHSNAWFVGAIPQLTAAVWVGFPRGQVSMIPPTTRITVFGGTWPA